MTSLKDLQLALLFLPLSVLLLDSTRLMLHLLLGEVAACIVQYQEVVQNLLVVVPPRQFCLHVYAPQ